jgi:diguanylate cyclase (GGDEF)-like protein
LDKSKAHAHSALEKVTKNAYLLPRVTAHRVLYEIALKNGDLATALTEYRLYAEADKARLDEVKGARVCLSTQPPRAATEEPGDRAPAVARTTSCACSRKSRRSRRKQSAARMPMLLLVLGVGGYWAYKIKRVQMMFRKQAQMDSLTGISNRGFFPRRVPKVHLARCKASNKEAALVLLDLDNFKHINDRYGHASGDWVLKQVATPVVQPAVKATCSDAWAARSFAILSCGGDLHTAERIAQQCRAALAEIDTSSIGHEHAIHRSFGCATTRLSGHVFEKPVHARRRAMYRAKAEGRDRVCAHEDNRPVLVRTQQAHA